MLNAEKRWIRRIQNNGHEESANKLIHRYYKEIFAYTYRRVFDQETAMDLTQEIFMRTLQSIHQFDTKNPLFVHGCISSLKIIVQIIFVLSSFR